LAIIDEENVDIHPDAV